MNMEIETTVKLELNRAEMRVIGLALAQRLRRPDDIAIANKLNSEILRLQSIKLGEAKSVVDGAMRYTLPKSPEENRGSSKSSAPRVLKFTDGHNGYECMSCREDLRKQNSIRYVYTDERELMVYTEINQKFEVNLPSSLTDSQSKLHIDAIECVKCGDSLDPYVQWQDAATAEQISKKGEP